MTALRINIRLPRAFNSLSVSARPTSSLTRPFARPHFVYTYSAHSHRMSSSSPAHKKQKMSDSNSHKQHVAPHEEESVEGIHAWKKKAPYKIHDSNDDFKAIYEASCHCGKVKYELSRETPLDSKLCHCTTCQTQHAAPFQWAAIFHKDDINFVHGHHNLEWYDPSEKSIEHKLPCKVRCAFCHSPIMDEGRNMILLFPSLIHFKNDQEKINFKPRSVKR